MSLSTDPPAAGQRVSLAQVVDLLAPALGEAKSREVILLAASGLGLRPDALDVDRALQVLLALAAHPGIVGVSARFARTRLLSPRRRNSSGPPKRRVSLAPEEEEPPPSRAVSAPVTVTGMGPAELAALLAPTLGTEKSREVVSLTMQECGLPDAPMDRAQALAILELAAKSPGIVGVAARFAKARLILRTGDGSNAK